MNPLRYTLIVSFSSLLAFPIFNACTPIQANSNSVSTEKVARLQSQDIQQIARQITVGVISGSDRSSGVLIARTGQDYTVVTNAP